MLSPELGVSDRTRFLGERGDVPQLFQCLDDAFALGISNTLLEAMATDLPVMATRVGGSVEVVKDGEGGFLIPVSDHLSLATTIGKYLGCHSSFADTG